jgi:hypothetical protein
MGPGSGTLPKAFGTDVVMFRRRRTCPRERQGDAPRQTAHAR